MSIYLLFCLFYLSGALRVPVPTKFPTPTAPTKRPSLQPTETPSSTPTITPTFSPSDSPSRQPTFNPTYFPTPAPIIVTTTEDPGLAEKRSKQIADQYLTWGSLIVGTVLICIIIGAFLIAFRVRNRRYLKHMLHGDLGDQAEIQSRRESKSHSQRHQRRSHRMSRKDTGGSEVRSPHSPRQYLPVTGVDVNCGIPLYDHVEDPHTQMSTVDSKQLQRPAAESSSSVAEPYGTIPSVPLDTELTESYGNLTLAIPSQQEAGGSYGNLSVGSPSDAAAAVASASGTSNVEDEAYGTLSLSPVAVATESSSPRKRSSKRMSSAAVASASSTSNVEDEAYGTLSLSPVAVATESSSPRKRSSKRVSSGAGSSKRLSGQAKKAAQRKSSRSAGTLPKVDESAGTEGENVDEAGEQKSFDTVNSIY